MYASNNEQLLKTARECFDKQEYKKAQVVLNEIIESDDRNVDALFLLANIFHINGEIGKAIKAFTKVLNLNPEHTDAAISLSVLYNDIGQYEDAKKVFDTANERVKGKNKGSGLMEDKHINKKFASKHYEIADLYLSYNRYDEALFEFNKVIGLDPENLEARIKIAKVYAKKGFIAKAIEELRNLKNEEPNYAPARIALGVIHYGNGNVLEAQAEWEKVLMKDPFHAEASMYMNLSKTATETRI
ncbi:tetratricopeptide repeat protein [Bacteriovorax sp. PP10]|jgi:tetratricopeptide (TPR) repeat protein|uniref:Tetratricopeptide repeat protein n=1 Tax=Bacteriovorax antarcticus TaxID=3088717 RepID=A0ABU5VPC2_9BACT|nr:tetratricopeptide repeat protein [Bacteriovorax sp. PP10]MEA9354888.1 tetratricopeptide repeat protein [Bacteriovorax sp. PP10]